MTRPAARRGVERFRGLSTPDPDADPADAPAAASSAAAGSTLAATPAAPPAVAPTPDPVASGRVSALDDPSIVPGRMGYRSFYVDDATFARYRAAIHWTARRHDASDDQAPSMGVDIERHMLAVARELEQRHNGGKTFPMPPAPGRRARRPRRGDG